jgi:hypothetical protein
MREYLCLSFSYMTFVILGQVENLEVNMSSVDTLPIVNGAFDLEAFTYLINRQTCFSSLVKDNYIKMKMVLTKLMAHGVIYLELLHYSDQDTNCGCESHVSGFMSKLR